jgi:hypothetical protein
MVLSPTRAFVRVRKADLCKCPPSPQQSWRMPALAESAGIATERTSVLKRSRMTKGMNGIRATTKWWKCSVERVRRVVGARHTLRGNNDNNNNHNNNNGNIGNKDGNSNIEAKE